MTRRRIVVTGMGIVSPVGSDIETAWQNIRAGNSGIRRIESFDVSDYSAQIAGEVRDLNTDAYLDSKTQRKTDPFIHYGYAAAEQAIEAAQLVISDDNRDRIGISVGAGIGGIGAIEKQCLALNKGGPRKVSPFFVPSSIINMVAGWISIEKGIRGPNLSTVTACTTATHNIGLAARLIAYGDADVFIAGGSEHGCTPAGMAGFCAARALSTRNDEPERASRPWDRDRDGFVLGDGAGVIVIEALEHAEARGAPILAELAGFGMSGDASHITLPSEQGEGAQRCMRRALEDAGLNPSDVDYINAHGTSTPAGDVAEAQAVRAVFGNDADNLTVSSTKSMTGHLLGAAGGVEAIFSVLAIRDRVAPPTINLENPGEGCDLDFVANEAREQDIGVALSNSFGFGGTNGTLIFRRFE